MPSGLREWILGEKSGFPGRSAGLRWAVRGPGVLEKLKYCTDQIEARITGAGAPASLWNVWDWR
eukprot:2432816-Rhodomonas_salina.1